MDDLFAHYLLSKQSVDDRALNRNVLEILKAHLAKKRLNIVEVGAGIGTMLVRLLRWGMLPASVDYTLVDEMPENFRFAHEWLPVWARENDCQIEWQPGNDMRLITPTGRVQTHFLQEDVFDFVQSKPSGADLLIAHAFLDLVPLPESLPRLFSLLKPGGLAWLTINFDGMTTFEPTIDPILDDQIEKIFHKTMDERFTNGIHSGDSRTGRHLFGHLQKLGLSPLCAGPSDWLVYPVEDRYPADEAAFLRFILNFFETSLTGRPDLNQDQFAQWLAKRRLQVERGELIYIAHQLDYLVRV